MKMSESEIQKAVMAVLNHRQSPCRVWRNNVGGFYDASGRYVEFGLAKGSADLIGVQRVLITPKMVGTTIAQFLSVEMKTPIGRLRPEQKAWLNTILTLGGEAKVMRSKEDAMLHVATLNK